MPFWSVLLLAIAGVYLLSTLSPWAALALLNRSLRRRMAGVPAIEARARQLEQARAEARVAYPEVPRPGMYADLDRQAHTLLVQLAEESQRLDTQRTDLLFFASAEPGLLAILRWGAWRPLLDALQVLNGLNHIEQTIASSERMLFQLDELKGQIADLARVPRQRLRDALAELDALEGALAADRAEGVAGIALDPDEIASVRGDLRAALERIDRDQEMGLQVPQISRQVDATLAVATPAIERMRATREEARLRYDAARTHEALAAALQAAQDRVETLAPDEGAPGAGDSEQAEELEEARDAAAPLLRRLAQAESAATSDLAAAIAAAGGLMDTLAALGYPRAQPEPEPEPAPDLESERESQLAYEVEDQVEREPKGNAEAALAPEFQDEGQPPLEVVAPAVYDVDAEPELQAASEPDDEAVDLPLGGYVRTADADRVGDGASAAIPAAEVGRGTSMTRAVEEHLRRKQETERPQDREAAAETADTASAVQERRVPFWSRRSRTAAGAAAADAAATEPAVAAGPAPVYERASADPAFQQAMQAIQTDDHAGGLAALEALRSRYPDDDNLERVIDWASLRADLKPEKTARPRQLIINWRRVVTSVVVISAALITVFYAVAGVQRYVLPVLAERRAENAYVRLVARCDSLLAAENIAEAETCYNEALAQRPDDEAVQAALQDIEGRNKLAAAYADCVAAYTSGDSQEALARCQQVQMLSPGYRDVQDRILTITQRARLDEIYAAAEQAREDGLLEEAVAGYEQLASLDTNYRAQEVRNARVELYIELGRKIISGNEPQLDLLLTANNYFAKALQLSPTQPEAQQERRLSSLFSDGVSLYQEGRWEDAIVRLRGVYDQRPTYFQQTLLSMLYDAYIRSGDQYRAAEDIAGAYERYYRASLLPIVDRTAADLRLAEVRPLITPTPMPTMTPTPAPTSTPVATRAPGSGVATPVPTAVPTARPLAAYSGQIIYQSLQADQPGYYVRDASGANPQYLGPAGSALEQQYAALLSRYMYSPDGRYRLYVASTGENQTAIFVDLPPEERTADEASRQLTNLNGKSWDPAWSPDGGRIVFVSNDTANTDDIWIVNADGSGLRNLTLGISAWDKRPSWSPDGTRIVFWSNREGPMQLYVMSADGRNVRNISQTSWDETDPLWIR